MKKNLPTKFEHQICRCRSSIQKLKTSRKSFSSLFAIFSVFSLFFFVNSAIAQTPNEAEWNGQGYSLKKIVSNTSIPSGVNFSYTIMFSAPAGATNITIFDEVPQALGNISVPTPSPVNGVTPGIQINGNTVSYTLTGLPANTASSGSFTIVTSFPAGTTCQGTAARNRAGIYIGEKPHYTPYVSTTATAEDPWKISKSIISGAVINPQGGNCGYLMNEGDTVRYRLHVSKKSPFWGNTNGQLNAANAIVTDVLPAGAQLVTSNTNAGTVVQNGNTIEWTIGNLDATIAYTNYTCNIDVYYPAGTFPNGSTINNQADLDAEICGAPVNHQSNETCIEVDDFIINADANFYKQISLTNRVPGCQGYYNIVLCNNGNVAFSPYTITDVIPQGLTVTGINVYNADATTTFSLTANNGNDVLSNNISSYYNSGNIGYNINDITLEMTNQHPVGKCIFMRVYFTIDNNVPIGQQITNCAHFDGQQNNLTLADACVSFTAEEGEPRPCLNKDICDVQTDYEPGDTVRFRLRVQNIGSATMTGATIQDVLNANFSYAGNESYYEASSYNVPCSTNGQIPVNTTAWQGVTTSHNGNNLSWNLPDIASDCQLFYVGFCSYYGTWALPYYYIEFDAVVDSFAMPGVTTNQFEISGGNLAQTSTSNTVYTLVVASLGQEISKKVSSDNGSNFANSANVGPGNNARYRLSYTNTSNIPLTEIEMVDLLAFNDNADDWLILDRNTARGSQFGVGYVGNHSTNLQPVGTIPPASIDFSSGDNLCLPNFGISVIGCTTANWNTTPDKNVRINYGTFSLAPAQALNEDFDVSVASTIGHDSTSCNDFAARASANFLLNGSPQAVTLTPIAAPPVCITSDTLQVSDSQCCENTTLETIQAPALGECCIQLKSECEVDSVHVEITNGTFFSSSWNCGTMPTDYVGQSSYTFDVAQCAVDMTSCITADSTGVVSANYTIYYSNGEVCEKNIEMDCHVQEPECCENVTVDVFQDPDLGECCARFVSKCETDSVMVTITNGTFDIVTLNGTTPASGIAGLSSFTFDTNSAPADLKTCVIPDSTGIVSINYVSYFANGEECEQNVRMDCKAPEPECCENVKVDVFQDPDLGECCAQFVSKCETDSVMVIISNGTFDLATLNGTTLTSGYAGQSSFTFNTNSAPANLVTCVTPNSTGAVYITYISYFANGEKCEKRVEMDCKATEPSSCCPELDFKLKPAWPEKNTYIGYFSITNPDPTSPICSVEINPTPGGSFSTGNLWIDGNLSGQSWTSSNIPASGNLMPEAYNNIDFTLKAKGYKGTIEVCITKCDGTVCCFEVKWNKLPVIDVDIEAGDIHIGRKLLAVSVSPYINEATDERVKYVAFGYFNEDEANDESRIFAASGDDLDCDDDGISDGAERYPGTMSIGEHNVFFELSCPYVPSKGEQYATLPKFNLVFEGRMPKLACTLFNEEGDIIYTGSIDVTAPDTTGTSVITPEIGASSKSQILRVYPNPNRGEFMVTFSTTMAGNVSLQVVNNVGQVLKTENIYVDKPGLHEFRINDPSIGNGVNHVILKTDNTSQSKPFIRK